MKIPTQSKSLIPLMLAVGVGGAATVWSPIGCGCAPDWMSIAVKADLNKIQDPEEITPRLLADGIARKLRGKRLVLDELPQASYSGQECTKLSSLAPAFRCTWWLLESKNNKRGFIADFSVDKLGKFSSVRITPIERPK